MGKKAMYLLAVLLCIIFCASASFALDPKSNGFDWKSAGYSEKAKLCKDLARETDHDYRWWIEEIDDFFDTTNSNMLRHTVDEAVGVILSEEFD